MYCPYCSNPLPPGTSFCTACGAPVDLPDRPAVPIQPGPVQAPPELRPQTGGKPPFWKTPGGILTIIFISVFVAGSLIAGLVFAFSGSGGDNAESLQNEWTQLNEIADEIDSELGPVSNLESIGSASQINNFQELLVKSDSGLDEIATNIKSLSLTEEEDDSRSSLLETVDSFQQYLKALDEFLGLFTDGTGKTKLDATLNEMSDLADKTFSSGENFARLNPGVTPSLFDPEVLKLPSDYVTQLAAVRATKTDKEQKDTGQETVEAVNSARKSLENILSVYVRKGWSDVVQFMTPALYAKYSEADPPWSQVSYTVESANIINFQAVDDTAIVFTVKEQHNEGGEITAENGDWEMVKSGDGWLLNNTPYTFD